VFIYAGVYVRKSVCMWYCVYVCRWVYVCAHTHTHTLSLAKVNCVKYKDLVPSFVSIMKQIVDRKLPREYDYHGVPAPWIQIDILRCVCV
jgi:hypothetical protein